MKLSVSHVVRLSAQKASSSPFLQSGRPSHTKDELMHSDSDPQRKAAPKWLQGTYLESAGPHNDGDGSSANASSANAVGVIEVVILGGGRKSLASSRGQISPKREC